MSVVVASSAFIQLYHDPGQEKRAIKAKLGKREKKKKKEEGKEGRKEEGSFLKRKAARSGSESGCSSLVSSRRRFHRMHEAFFSFAPLPPSSIRPS